MKSLSIPFFIALIVFFINCRREFNHYNDETTLPTATLFCSGQKGLDIVARAELNSLASVQKTGNDSLHQREPAIEVNLVERTEPETETGGVDTLFVEIEESSPQKTLIPTAIPVVPPEEAEKANMFAIFLSTAKSTVVEGEIIERSKLPNPQESDYPNCRFTAHFNGNSIKHGEPCPKEISLVIEGFKNFSVLESNKLISGDRVECSIIPFDNLPEEFKSTQQADDLNMFLLENYYVTNIKKIRSYSDEAVMPRSGIFFLDGNKKYVSIFSRHLNAPIPKEIKDAQNDSIINDLHKMEKLLKDYDKKTIGEMNKRFDEVWKEEKKKDPVGYNRVGKNVWRNINDSFWALPEDYVFLTEPSRMSRYVLDCFSSLKNACESNGVQLIVSIVPNIYVISSRVINSEFRNIPDLQTATYVKQLSEIGVEAIYASDTIIRNYDSFPFAFFFPSNGHPGDTAQDCIANILAERLRRYHIPSDLDPDLFSTKMENTRVYNISSRVFPPKCDTGKYKDGEIFECRHIYYNGLPIKDANKSSGIMVIGNSFLKTPMNASPDYALPVLIMYKTSSSVDYQGMSGQFTPLSDMILRMISNPEFYLKDKKVLIIHIGADHMQKAFSSDAMVNCSEVDQERLTFNNREFKLSLSLSSNTTEEKNSENDSLTWGSLLDVEKTVLRIGKDGLLSFDLKLSERQKDLINDSKPIICVIPYASTRTQQDIDPSPISFTVNGIPKIMQNSHDRFSCLLYELSAWTQGITINVRGKPDTLFAIKDIQIWQ